MSPIPWSVIKDYAEAWELDEEQTEDLFCYVREMDIFYIGWESNRVAKQSSK